MKQCSKCGNKYLKSNFYKNKKRKDGLTPWCKTCFKKSNNERKAKIAEYQRNYYENNKSTIIKRKNIEYKKRKDNDIQFKLRIILRDRIRNLVKNKSKTIDENLGCTIDEYRQYLESKFQPGMNWDNYGIYWHIDHIIPLSKLELTNDRDLRKAIHYSNTQPMLAINNKKKGNRRPIVYIVAGAFGAGKSWVCNQLNNLAHYVPYDKVKNKTHMHLLYNPPNFDKPIIYDRHVKLNKFILDHQEALDLRPVFILEPESVIKERVTKRGGNFNKAIQKRIKRMESLATKYAVFSGSSNEVLTFLKNQLK